MKLGVGSYTYTWAVGVPGRLPAQPLTAMGLLDKAAALGVRVVQLADNLPLHALPPDELDAFVTEAGRRGVILELGARGLDPDRLGFYLRLAQRVGAPFVRLVVDSAGDEPTPAQTIARLRPIVAAYARAGVKLALENHDRFPARVLAEVVEQLGRKDVGICLDTVNSFGALEGPAMVVDALAPYTLNLHVKDFMIRRVASQMGFEVTGCPAGQGRLDVPWLLERLRAARREVNAIVELWTSPADSLDATLAREAAWAEESVRYLRTLIAD